MKQANKSLQLTFFRCRSKMQVNSGVMPMQILWVVKIIITVVSCKNFSEKED